MPNKLIERLRGSLSTLLYFINTLFWFVPVLLLGLIKLLQRPPSGHAVRAAAQQFGRQVEQQLIDQPLRQQRAVEDGTGFDVQLVDAVLAQIVEHGGQIDPACGARFCNNRSALRLQ